jgi:hypothetical protein
MRAWAQFFAVLYGVALAGLAMRGQLAPPPWFFFVGAVAVLVQVFLYRSRAHFWLFLPINLLVVPTTVALGYHYLLDVPAGVLLASAILAMPERNRARGLLRRLGNEP